MKLSQKLLTALAAFCFTAMAPLAADPTPPGTWKWTQQGPQGIERSLTLEFKGGALTGTLKGATMGQFEIPDRPIEAGSFKDGAISFSVTTEFNGNKRTTKYTGKLAGDKITGESEGPGRGGEVMKREWNATRAK